MDKRAEPIRTAEDKKTLLEAVYTFLAEMEIGEIVLLRDISIDGEKRSGVVRVINYFKRNTLYLNWQINYNRNYTKIEKKWKSRNKLAQSG